MDPAVAESASGGSHDREAAVAGSGESDAAAAAAVSGGGASGGGGAASEAIGAGSAGADAASGSDGAASPAGSCSGSEGGGESNPRRRGRHRHRGLFGLGLLGRLTAGGRLARPPGPARPISGPAPRTRARGAPTPACAPRTRARGALTPACAPRTPPPARRRAEPRPPHRTGWAPLSRPGLAVPRSLGRLFVEHALPDQRRDTRCHERRQRTRPRHQARPENALDQRAFGHRARILVRRTRLSGARANRARNAAQRSSPRQVASTISCLARSSSCSLTGTDSKIQLVSTCSTRP